MVVVTAVVSEKPKEPTTVFAVETGTEYVSVKCEERSSQEVKSVTVTKNLQAAAARECQEGGDGMWFMGSRGEGIEEDGGVRCRD